MLKKLITAAVTAGAAMLAGQAAIPASAAPVHAASSHTVIPNLATNCTGDACIRLYDPSGGKDQVRAWAYNTSFYGHFEVTGAGIPGGYFNSKTQIWYAGGSGGTLYYTPYFPAVVGQ